MKKCKHVLPVLLCLLCDFTDKNSNSVLTVLIQVQFLPLVSVRILFNCLRLFLYFIFIQMVQILRQGEVVALVNVKSGLGLWLEFAPQ